jgi:tetratricopeptide (TPR) repeat protein
VGPFRVEQVREKFTVFWVPTFTTSEEVFLVCAACQALYKVPAKLRSKVAGELMSQEQLASLVRRTGERDRQLPYHPAELPAKDHCDRGVEHYRQGEVDEAILEFQEALKFDPNDGLAHYNLAIAYGGQGRFDEAIDEYEEALRIKPDYAQAHHGLGFAYHSQGKFDEAIDEYNEALTIDPDYAPAHYNLAIVYRGQGRLDEAIDEYEEALRVRPDDALTHYNLAVAYHAQGDYEDAVQRYKAFLQLASPEHAAYVTEAEAALRELEKTGDG